MIDEIARAISGGTPPTLRCASTPREFHRPGRALCAGESGGRRCHDCSTARPCAAWLAAYAFGWFRPY